MGLATGEGTVIHAASREVGVVETSLAEFQDADSFRGARRLVTDPERVITFFSPHRTVELSDDLRWIIMQGLEKK